MLNKIKKIFASKGPQLQDEVVGAANTVAGFQPARMEHAKFIFDLILREAANGHFNADYRLELAQPGLRHQIKCSIISNSSPTTDGVKESVIYVMLDNDVPVGFSWIVEFEKPKEYELYLFAVSSGARRRGLGKRMLDESIHRFPAGTKLHLRLYRASETMLKMVVARGFKRQIKQGRNTTHLSYICPEIESIADCHAI